MKKNNIPALAAIALLACTSAAPGDFALSEKDGTLQIHDGGKLITAFRTDYRVPYLYPLVSPSGANILRHWPMEQDAPTEEKDHPHHRGLWLSHGAVNGYDFWAEADKKNATIRLESITEKKTDDGVAKFTANLTWTAEGKEILHETRSHDFSKPDAKTLRINIRSTLTALQGKWFSAIRRKELSQSAPTEPSALKARKQRRR